MRKIYNTFKTYGLITLGLAGLVTVSAVANRKRTPMSAGVNGKTLVLKDTLSFSDGGSASATTKDEIYFDGRIVADAKVAKAPAYQIDGVDSLAFYITEATAGSRYITVNVDTYDVLRFDYKVNAGSMKIDFGCQETHMGKNGVVKIEVNTFGYHEIVMELWTTSKTAQASMNNFEFYSYE